MAYFCLVNIPFYSFKLLPYFLQINNFFFRRCANIARNI